ncbi:MAG: hypothetical protein R3A52_31665 [Polyangiales bacterium]
MKRLGWILPSLALGACSFPTESFTLATGDDVPTVTDTGVTDAGAVDTGPADTGAQVDTGAADVAVDAGWVDAGDDVTDVSDAGDDVTDVGADTGPDVPTIMCPTGQTACGGACVDPLTDEAHCGRCDVPCSDTSYCQNGSCVAFRGSYREDTPVSPITTDACMLAGATTILGGQDDSSVDAMLPFDAPYWGVSYPTSSLVTISSNGWLSFDRESSRYGGRYAAPIPARDAPNGIIAPLLLDLVTRPGICIGRDGVAPDRRWIVQWDNARYFVDNGNPAATPPLPAANVTFEAIIHETSGDVEFLYPSLPTYPADAGPPRTVTVGVESQNGALGTARCSAVPAGTCSGLGTGARIRYRYFAM